MRMLFNETIVLHIYLLDWFILVELFVRVAKDVEQDLVWKKFECHKMVGINPNTTGYFI